MLKEKATDKGMILVKDLTAGPNENDTSLINAHKNKIQKMEFSHDLKFIAAAAKDSPVIRIFRVRDSSLFKEIRKQYCLGPLVNLRFDNAFLNSAKGITSADEQTSNYLMMTDKMGNMELFFVKEHQEDPKMGLKSSDNLISNRRSMFSFLKSFVPYFDNEWSFAFLKNFEELKDPVYSFQKDGTLVCVDKDHKIRKVEFDMIFGGSCKVNDQIDNFSLSLVE